MRENNFSYHGWIGVRRSALLGLLTLFLASSAKPQACSPYADFQAMSLAQLQTLQVKLTYVGVQDKGVPSVGFTTSSQAFNPALFIPVRRPNVSYTNDDSKINTFTATALELQALISSVAALPNVTAGGLASSQFLSFSMVNPAVNSKCFEAVLNLADTTDLFTKLRMVFLNDPPGLKRITDLGCPLAILDPARPTDVSASVGVTVSGLRVNRATGRFVGTATIKNNLATAITGPASLVVDTQGNVRLANAVDTTCGTTPVGVPFIDIPLTGNTLAGGATVQVTLEFSNPDAEPIKPTTKVLAGAGAR